MRDEIAHHVSGIIEPMRSVVRHFQGVHLVAAVAGGKTNARTKIEVNVKLGGEEVREAMSGTDCRNMIEKYESKWSTVETNLPEGEPKGKVTSDNERQKYYRVNNLEGSEVNVFDQLRAVLSNNCNSSPNTFNMSDTILIGWHVFSEYTL
ncbi:Hypothetical predicted protein [Olea europaea subsp. europaea]|uniref:Uncharacterized protein n=1 Tax=Olea europaea subsp. europaea TaxID=158383 RepID=A0A8S0TBD7_OLEEU|nr:Hypothetical predicted protein [Olea europaea subsp. europaea]